MKYSIMSFAFAGLLAATQAWAVPVLQVGAPGGAGEGTYANYQGSTSTPTESDTAITSGGTLFVAGVFGPNTLTLGGQSSGSDWSSFGFPTLNFDGHGGILLVSVPDGTLATALANLTVNGFSAFYSNATTSYFPNNHAPVQSGISDFLFFDIGDFSKNLGVVPDFATETGAANGEIKSLTVSGFGSLAWAHFDVMALETSTQGPSRIVTTVENNPGSHDVTWKSASSSGQTSSGQTSSGQTSSGQTSSGNTIPEPGVLALLSVGLLGQALLIRQRRRRQK